MRIAAIIPVKALDGAKQRLSATLNAPGRADLVLWLLRRVVAAVRDSGAVNEIAVVSPDADVLAQARELGATALRQMNGDLNGGLEIGRAWALEQRADALLVVLGDLPRLQPGDIQGMVARLRDDTGPTSARVILAPDRAATGTNALLMRPPSCLPFSFGSESRARHQMLARRQRVQFELYHAPGIAFDVDRVADLEELRASGLRAASEW